MSDASAALVPAAVLDPVRLAAVRETGLLDSAPDPGMDALTTLAAHLLGAPFAFATLVDTHRSFWLACAGVGDGSRQNPVEQSFCQYVIDSKAPLFVEDATTNPLTADNPSVDLMGVRAWAGCPLVGPTGDVLGSFCVVDTVPRAWTADQRQNLRRLGDAAASQVALLSAVDSEREARSRLQLLASASELLLTEREPDRVLQRLTGLLVPGLATWCTAWRRTGDLLQPVAYTGSDPAGSQPWPPVRADGGSLAAVTHRTHRVQATPDLAAWLDRAAGDEAITRAGRERGIGPAIGVPLLAGSRCLGTLVLVRRPGDAPFSEIETETVVEMAGRAAAALLLVLDLEREREVAEVLQRSLLPQLPDLHDVEFSVRYRPAYSSEVGGDWYDVIDLGAGRVAVTVGDVMGRGVRAAAVMGQLRTALRTMVRLDLPPTEVLGRLDELAGEMHGTPIVTCVLAVLDTVSGHLEWASAGHPPPLVRTAEGSRWLRADEEDPPLGVDTAPYEAHRTTLSRGDVLCLCTDGLIEDRTRDLDDGLRLLADSFCELRSESSLEAQADELLRRVDPGQDDDMAMLLLHWPLLSEQGRHRESLFVPAEAASVMLVREWALRLSQSWCGPECRDTVALVASELVTNAIVHARSAVQVEIRLAGPVLVLEVHDSAHRPPSRRIAADQDENGRGLLLIEAMTSRWGHRATEGGKVVWAEILVDEATN